MTRPLTLLDGNGQPIRPVAPMVGAPVFGHIVEGCTILFVSGPKRPSVFALGANHADIRFLLDQNPGIPFHDWKPEQVPDPGFYVYEFTFKATEKPSLLNSKIAMQFHGREIRLATFRDFRGHNFPLTFAEIPLAQIGLMADTGVQRLGSIGCANPEGTRILEIVREALGPKT